MIHLPRLIGVIHLPPLAGAPNSHGYHPAEILQNAGALAVKEAKILEEAGFDGVILENFGDAPFFKTRVPAETVASMAIIAAAVRDTVKVQVGLNVLRNDAHAALAIAAVTGCDFIRVNVLTGVTATDQGMVEGEAASLIRERERLHVPIAILADAHVKHGISVSSRDMGLAIEELTLRGMADGVIVTGASTGRLAHPELIQIASQTARGLKIPLYLGSGARQDQVAELKPWVDGMIVGSSLRKGGVAGAPLDAKKARQFVQAIKKAPKGARSATQVGFSGKKGRKKKRLS